MFNQFLKQSYSEAEIPQMVRKLNAFYREPLQWESRRAQREHQDLFGRRIQSGERYFRLIMDGSYNNGPKLSYTSMERVLYFLFYPNPHLVDWADKIIDERWKKVRKIIDQMRGIFLNRY